VLLLLWGRGKFDQANSDLGKSEAGDGKTRVRNRGGTTLKAVNTYYTRKIVPPSGSGGFGRRQGRRTSVKGKCTVKELGLLRRGPDIV